jgi:hypothetical protein
MQELTANEKQELLDRLGKRVIEHVRDGSLEIGMSIAKGTTVNPIKKNQYSRLANLSDEEKELVCDLLSETITGTIYDFFKMLEAHSNEMRFVVLTAPQSMICAKFPKTLAVKSHFRMKMVGFRNFRKSDGIFYNRQVNSIYKDLRGLSNETRGKYRKF